MHLIYVNYLSYLRYLRYLNYLNNLHYLNRGEGSLSPIHPPLYTTHRPSSTSPLHPSTFDPSTLFTPSLHSLYPSPLALHLILPLCPCLPFDDLSFTLSSPFYHLITFLSSLSHFITSFITSFITFLSPLSSFYHLITFLSPSYHLLTTLSHSYHLLTTFLSPFYHPFVTLSSSYHLLITFLSTFHHLLLTTFLVIFLSPYCYILILSLSPLSPPSLVFSLVFQVGEDKRKRTEEWEGRKKSPLPFLKDSRNRRT